MGRDRLPPYRATQDAYARVPEPKWCKKRPLHTMGSWARYIDPATVRPLQALPGARASCPLHAAETAALPNGIGVVRWPRVVPKDAECAKSLKKRTLTNLYNQRPAWLAQSHQKLDDAVFAAYGWDPGISDDELLARLLRLNLERSGR
jgi:hypothetical protein